MKKILKLIGIFLLLIVVVIIGFTIFTKPSSPSKITIGSQSTIYRSLNGTPSENLTKVIELIGGIDKIIKNLADCPQLKSTGTLFNCEYYTTCS